MVRADLIKDLNFLADDIENDEDLDAIVQRLRELADWVDSEGIEK